MSELSHLDQLEAEAIYIIREVAASCEKPVSDFDLIIKSGTFVFLKFSLKEFVTFGEIPHLAMKAFYPEKPPFPFLHVNTTWKFKEMIKFRDETAKKYGLEMIEYINEDGVKQGVNQFDSGAAYTDIMKTQALKQALNKYGFTAAFGGGRRDEEKSSLLEMKIRHGIQRTRDQKCGNYITLRSKKEKAFVYSQSLTGQRQISGNILNAKKLISFHYILQKNAQ